RRDHQVKVRGYRIELGEVEAALRDCAAVKDAVAGGLGEGGGQNRRGGGGVGEAGEQKRLVAWVVEREGMEVSVAELRRELEERLPDYMIPAAFIKLDRLPVTSNGKLDRRALPQPDTSRPELDVVCQAPRSESEGLLVEIWEQVLRVSPVGIHDNFFELGGDSILSIQIVALAARRGLRLSPMEIFQRQTIAELAAQSRS